MIEPETGKIVRTLFLIVVSYLIPSFFLSKNIFYIFSILWSVSISLWVVFIERVKTDLDLKKSLILALVVIVDYFLVSKFSPNIAPVNIFMAVVMAPIMEELLFRGWVVSKLKGDRKNKIIRSSILFGVYHLKNTFVLSPLALIYQIFYAGFFVGPLFTWVRLRYDSLFASMMLHSLNNTIAFTVTEKLLPLILSRSVKYSDLRN